ncbi:hypothetical protein PBRA_007729, partial [Plasmodiophora brassicae]
MTNDPVGDRLRAALSAPGNERCADCRSPDPSWASHNIGVFLCQDCAGVHRSLGTHISRVRSVTLDTWDAPSVAVMLSRGNRLVNDTMEALLPLSQRIGSDVAARARDQFIRAKYVNRRFQRRTAPAPAAPESPPDDIFAGLTVVSSAPTCAPAVAPQAPSLLDLPADLFAGLSSPPTPFPFVDAAAPTDNPGASASSSS